MAVVSPAQVPADEEAIARQLARTNAVFGPDARISKVVVAADRFSIANGLLTSQYKPHPGAHRGDLPVGDRAQGKGNTCMTAWNAPPATI